MSRKPGPAKKQILIRIRQECADSLSETAEAMQYPSLPAYVAARLEADETTALYRLFDSSGSLLYVGITSNVGNRMQVHSSQKEWWAEVATIDLEFFATRAAAGLAEIEAIANELPSFNKSKGGEIACREPQFEEPRQQISVELPKSWLPELKAASDKRFMSRNAYICAAVRRVLDGESLSQHSKSASKAKHPTASLPLERDAAPMPKKRDQK